MIRAPLLRVPKPVWLVAQNRSFSASVAVLKKKGGGASAQDASSNSASSGLSSGGIDKASIENALEETLKTFDTRVKEARLTSSGTEKFDKLEIDLGSGSTATLQSLATVAARGNRINIVAYDPKQVKRIQSAIVSQLNMPAETSPTDKQTLNVQMPRQTEEKRAAVQKLIKDAFESLRNNASNRHSIVSIRAKYLNPLKKAASKSSGVSKDDVRKQTQTVEQILKTYSTRLQDAFKKAS